MLSFIKKTPHHFCTPCHAVLIFLSADTTAKQKLFPSEQRLISALCVDFAEAKSQEQTYYQANLLLPFVSYTLYQTTY